MNNGASLGGAPIAAAGGAAERGAAARRVEGDVGAVNPRWKVPPGSHQISGAYKSIVMTDKRRRSNEQAAKGLNDSLIQETLDGLRQKALDLQNDKWMYEDVHM